MKNIIDVAFILTIIILLIIVILPYLFIDLIINVFSGKILLKKKQKRKGKYISIEYLKF
jgi:uncharacterized membrane protein YobD (UPF0266 family)